MTSSAGLTASTTSIGCNAGVFYSKSGERAHRTGDGRGSFGIGQPVSDTSRIVFVRVGDSPVAVPFLFIAFHGEDI